MVQFIRAMSFKHGIFRASSSEEENLRKEERIAELQARMEKVKEEADSILEQVTCLFLGIMFVLVWV